MVKDSAGSHDGWFWSNPVKGQCVGRQPPVPVRPPGVRVRASTASAATPPPSRPAPSRRDANEFTFVVAAEHRRVSRASRSCSASMTRGGSDADGRSRATPATSDEAHDSHPSSATRPRCTPDAARAVHAEPTRVPGASSTRSSRPSRRTWSHLPPVTHDWVVRRPRTRRSAAVRHLQPVHELPRRAGGAVRAVDVRARPARAPSTAPPGVGRVAVRRVAVDADGPGRPRPGLLRPARERDRS